GQLAGAFSVAKRLTRDAARATRRSGALKRQATAACRLFLR
ncbi:MAG: hypothetical protein ACI87T_003517, partial [Planctomycetota bacterium]